MRSVQFIALLLLAVATHCNAARVMSSAAQGFMAHMSQPALVANKLSAVEDDWLAQVKLYSECAAKGESAKLCQRVYILFQKSCSAISSAFVKGQNNDQDQVRNFMSSVCSGDAFDDERRNVCFRFQKELVDSVTPNSDPNANAAGACDQLWKHMLAQFPAKANATSSSQSDSDSSSNSSSSSISSSSSSNNSTSREASGNASSGGNSEGHAQASDSTHTVVKPVQVSASMQERSPQLKVQQSATVPPPVTGVAEHHTPAPSAAATAPAVTTSAPVAPISPLQTRADISEPAVDQRSDQDPVAADAATKMAPKAAHVTAAAATEDHPSAQNTKGRLVAKGPTQDAATLAAQEKQLLAKWHHEQDLKHKKKNMVRQQAAAKTPTAVLKASEEKRRLAEKRAADAQKVLDKAIEEEKRIKEVSEKRKKQRAVKEAEERRRWMAKERERRRRMRAGKKVKIDGIGGWRPAGAPDPAMKADKEVTEGRRRRAR